VTLIARFQVDSFEPRQVTGLDADWVGLMTFAKTFTSGIVGRSTTLFMSAGTQEGSRLVNSKLTIAGAKVPPACRGDHGGSLRGIAAGHGGRAPAYRPA
jgi:hypothetical protein